MKVLQITPSYKPAFIYGGPVNSVSALCEGLSKKISVLVITTTANGKKELDVETKKELMVDGVPVIYFKRITKDHTHYSPPLFRWLRKNIDDFDVIHIHSWWGPIPLFALIIGLRHRKKIIVSPRGMLSDYVFNNHHRWEKKVMHYFISKKILPKTFFHATTFMEKEECLKVIPSWRGFILPNLIQLPAINTIKKQNAVFKVIFLSRIDEKKGLEYSLRAMAKIKDESFIFQIAGDGDTDYIMKLKQLVTFLGIEDKIEWIGWLDNEKKYSYLQAADLFILTSYNENFGNAVIEALHSGTPVLISKNTGLSDFVEKNNLGWSVNLEVNKIAAQLKDAIQDKEKRSNIENNATRIVEENFSSGVVIDKYIEMYHAVKENNFTGNNYFSNLLKSQEKRKILFITPSYKPAYIYGGTTIVVAQLAEHFASLGYEVTVYTTTANGQHELDVKSNIPVNISGVKIFYFKRITKDHTHASPALWNYLRKTVKNYNTVHIHSWWNYLVLGAIIICRLKKVVPIVSPHGMFSHYIMNTNNAGKKRIMQRLIGKKLLQKSYLHVSSEMEWDECRRVIPGWWGKIIPNPLALPVIGSNIHCENNIFTIGFLSRIEAKKGLDILINALAKVDFKYRLLIAGSGKEEYLATLNKLANNLQISPYIEWVGWKNIDEKFKFFSSLDLFALTSRSENFALVVVESLSVGTPVLISKYMGLSNYVSKNNFGWVTDLEIVNITQRLNEAYIQSEKRKNIRNRSPQIVNADFDVKMLSKEYINFYKECDQLKISAD